VILLGEDGTAVTNLHK